MNLPISQFKKEKSEDPLAELSPILFPNAQKKNEEEEDMSLGKTFYGVGGTPFTLKDTKNGAEVVTPWKGQIVPMNDHSDKEAVVYTCPQSGLSYRFILHRRNHQKADNYACARCKSRKKYVRILIAGEYFLEDPSLLDHICYLNQEQLRDARERSQDVKSKEMLRERQKLAKRTLARLSQYASTSTNSSPLDQLDLSSIQHETPLFPVSTIAKLFGDDSIGPEETQMNNFNPSTTSPYSTGDEDDVVGMQPSASNSILDSLINNTLSSKKEPKEDVQPPPAKIAKPEEREVIQRSDPEPQEPKPTLTATRSSQPTADVFSISLNRALDSLLPEYRGKAENEILRFVYSNLYEKYGPK